MSNIDALTPSDRKQLAEILKRRANEIASHHLEYTRDNKHHGSVELALSREIDRLRRLADRVDPEVEEDDDA
ncbi:hypothetical protein [Pseudorhodoferax sp. Leaf274]|uniref:hypothetical protein n=1 Tax=Pseudorhodoferax sp. Leaf274 TaxID=1736318 RepID=UPI000703AA61|nr:hypothetical protein [Pseudorhodoferax sp. Leaf274]KQP36361.1 hypothetical protein ASF44_17600 [Pseudorhodoferax sp. Leaf274]